MKPHRIVAASLIAISCACLFTGCQSAKSAKEPAHAQAATPAPVAAKPAAPAKPATPAASVAAATVTTATAAAPTTAAIKPPVRIKAGPGDPFKDADGNAWIAETGFADGLTTERPTLSITNTTTPFIYLSEKYSMTAFSYPVPNGRYTVKLHFSETYEGINGPGERVFSFNVEGKEFKDFDVWVKAGGPFRAYIETVPVEVTDGKLDITFTPKVENPQVCGIEILPR